MAFDVQDPPPLPPQSTPVLNPDGTFNVTWYRYFAFFDRAFRAVTAFLRSAFP